MEVTKEKNEAKKQQPTKKTSIKKNIEKASSTEKKAVTTKAKNVSKSTTKSSKTAKEITSKPIQKRKKLAEKDATVKPKKIVTAEKDSTTKSKKIVTAKQDNAVIPVAEYYDLPYRYNQTIVKILAQTPHSLFIYWDISDEDRSNLIKNYGDNFFNETKPILLVHNQTLNTSFEIEIDDFTNSWYLKTPTSNCVFNIELGRKKITPNHKMDFENSSNILHITASNMLESPNDHILNELPNRIYFKNITTNQIEVRDISNSKQKNISNLIGLYQDNNEYEHNPSSGFNMFQVI